MFWSYARERYGYPISWGIVLSDGYGFVDKTVMAYEELSMRVHDEEGGIQFSRSKDSGSDYVPIKLKPQKK